MKATATQTWQQANHRYLMMAIAAVRSALQQHLPNAPVTPAPTAMPTFSEADWEMPPALEQLSRCFSLTPFEREVLLLCAGMELSSAWGDLCQAAGGDRHAYPTFELAQQVLCSPHWSAFLPAAPLRQWQLVELGPSNSLLTAPLRLNERILHELLGFAQLDDRLTGMIQSVTHRGGLVDSHERLVNQVLAAWTTSNPADELPIIQLCGLDYTSKQAIAAATCERLGVTLYRLSSKALPTNLDDVRQFIRLWEREVWLGQVALLVDGEGMPSGDSHREIALSLLLESLDSRLIWVSRDRRPIPHRPSIALSVNNPTHEEQIQLWLHHSQSAPVVASTPFIDTLVGQFDLNTAQITAANLEAQTTTVAQASDAEGLSLHLWEACRIQSRPEIEDLAQRLTPQESWDDLVLPDAQKAVLRQMVSQVRQRSRVYHAWGFARKSNRGLGISTLFAGVSGTGKTMAAGVIAQELQLDLYRIDLSAIVSKYIGETEKNLRRVFDAAESGGVVLLFDEADALFGKRSEVKDSHDRYANMEVSYLLQRMESYRGLAILTTNLMDAIDTAFLRRIRFIVRFPFPSYEQRICIWEQVFPATVPTQALNFRKLARLNTAGGNIRNIALTAAFFAAAEDVPVSMLHLLRAAQSEYNKLERPIPPAEIRGWVTAEAEVG